MADLVVSIVVSAYNHEQFIERAKIVQVKDSCTIGANTGLSRNGEIMDSDWPPMYGKLEAKVRIGQHAWPGPDVKILKGADIDDDCIVPQDSTTLAGDFAAGHLVAGTPAVVRKRAPRFDYKEPDVPEAAR